ncbi:MAG: Gfo/Idh/MocA family oxidoreductase [Armatimonadetes bacterium]|nr:Gfo/Idh/MocA family oxidoreductase [Armatimonadota bacterium]MDW8027492.1 Gfo/Idh/MocA family oxidoreductase [Armatimonadota bacterium]
MAEKRYRVGILGCGGIANAHARAILKTGQMDFVAFCDIDEVRAKDFNERYAQGGAKVFTDYRKMFELVEMDIVYICLPPFAHSDEVEIAAKAGVHIFIEKPIALDMETASRMVKACKENKVKSQVGFLSRHGEAVQTVKRMIESSEAGQVGLFIAWYMCNSLHSPWWRDKSKSGGQIVEQIIHTYDIARFLLGEPVSVFCHLDNLFHRHVPDYTSEDVSATSVRFKNGAVATIAGTNGAIPNKWISHWKLVMQNFTVEFENANNATLVQTNLPYTRTLNVNSDKDLFLAETLDLINAIENDVETLCPIDEGAKTLKFVLAVRESGETGKVVTIEQ